MQLVHQNNGEREGLASINEDYHPLQPYNTKTGELTELKYKLISLGHDSYTLSDYKLLSLMKKCFER